MLPRLLAQPLALALSDSRVVLLTGPRQSGKTTLVQAITQGQMPYFTLDDAATRQAALGDPSGFIRSLDRAVIDEVQRAPDLLLAIKESVDRDGRRGRFLLTGSANLRTLPAIADSLAGRAALLNLLPLAAAELDAGQGDFLARAFIGELPQSATPTAATLLVDRVFAGGYPEALAKPTLARRQAWLRDYLDALLERDVREIARLEHAGLLPRLVRVLAEHAGQLVNLSVIGASLGLSHVTTRRYLAVLEQLFLMTLLPPWSGNELARLIKTPKLHFLDSGLVAAIRGLTPERLQRDRKPLGPLLEGYVIAELLKLMNAAAERYRLYHFRDRDGHEVDVVIEHPDGRVIGIEVKSSATVTPADFKGLRRLQALTGERFVLGLVLCEHDRHVPFGEHLHALPVSTLWR